MDDKGRAGRTEWVYINKHVYLFLSLPSLTVPPAPYIDNIVVEFMDSLNMDTPSDNSYGEAGACSNGGMDRRGLLQGQRPCLKVTFLNCGTEALLSSVDR